MKVSGLCTASLLISLTASAMANAATVEFQCPEEIKTKQSAAVVVKGWTPMVDLATTRQIFTGLALYDGPPKDGALLFADEAAASGEQSADAVASTDIIYKIPQGRQAYVVCQYTGTLVRMTKKLPKEVQICRVKFSETLRHVQKAVCE